MTEAVIQFEYRLHSPARGAASAAAAMTPVLRAARELGVVGRDPRRYDGLAFGNLSWGQDGRFWITATQTADKSALGADDVVLIEDFAIEQNRVSARGALPPSSEALSHAALHARRHGAPTWILHGHHPGLWQEDGRADLPVTDPAAANGTVAMARAVAAAGEGGSGLVIMGGHRDGVIAYAADADGVLAEFRAALERLSRTDNQPTPGSPHARRR